MIVYIYFLICSNKRPRALVVGRYSKFLRFDLIWFVHIGSCVGLLKRNDPEYAYFILLIYT